VKYLFIIGIIGLFMPCTQADTFHFYPITQNDKTGDAQQVGETQLLMNLYRLAAGLSRLVIVNEGAEEAVVSQIYFDWMSGQPLVIESIGNGPDVRFSEQAVNPANLPAGRSIFPAFVSDLAIGAVKPGPRNGINPGEHLELTISHDEAYPLGTALRDGSLRVGLHVIGIGEYSESFINVVPEPATMPLLISGSILLRFLGQSRNRRKQEHTDSIRLPLDGAPNELQWVEIQTKTDHGRKPRSRCEAAIHKMKTFD
jgi:hypothetical protein